MVERLVVQSLIYQKGETCQDHKERHLRIGIYSEHSLKWGGVENQNSQKAVLRLELHAKINSSLAERKRAQSIGLYVYDIFIPFQKLKS